MVDSTVVAQQINYCMPAKITCRTLFLLKEKVSGQPVNRQLEENSDKSVSK